MSPYDEGQSGGGSTTTVCTPSPSDNAAILGNLISRISDIEKFLSQLVGADVYANNLSELAVNLGNVLNGTITLPNSDNSPYGVGGSIPVPDGFNGTVISGNVTTIWTNGVVSFQVDNTGIVAGGASANYLVRTKMTGQSIGSGGLNDLLLTSPDLFTDTIGATFNSDNFTLPRSGYYYISAMVYTTQAFNPSHMALGLEIYDTNYPLSNDNHLYFYQDWINDGTNNYSAYQTINISGIIYVTAGDACYIELGPIFSGGASMNAQVMHLSILEL